MNEGSQISEKPLDSRVQKPNSSQRLFANTSVTVRITIEVITDQLPVVTEASRDVEISSALACSKICFAIAVSADVSE